VRLIGYPVQLGLELASHVEDWMCDYPVLPATGRTVLAWQQTTSAVDEFCRFEALLTLQRTREQVAFSDWVCGEFLRQLAGEPPVPWAECARIDSR
jgi:hypothetical protein